MADPLRMLLADARRHKKTTYPSEGRESRPLEPGIHLCCCQDFVCLQPTRCPVSPLFILGLIPPAGAFGSAVPGGPPHYRWSLRTFPSER